MPFCQALQKRSSQKQVFQEVQPKRLMCSSADLLDLAARAHFSVWSDKTSLKIERQQDKHCRQTVGTAIQWIKHLKNLKAEDWGKHWPRTKILGISRLWTPKTVYFRCKAEPVMSLLWLRHVEALITPKSNAFSSQSSWTPERVHIFMVFDGVTDPWSLDSGLRSAFSLLSLLSLLSLR